MNLLSNISQNFLNLQNDFISISINFPGIIKVFLNIIFSIFFISACFSIGEKLSKFFIDSALNKYKNFIYIAVGYIVFGTFLSLIGIFSLLYSSILIVVAILFFICGVYFFVSKRKYTGEIFYQAFTVFRSKSILYSAVIVFVVIIGLRLLIPETAEDDYHTDLPNLYLFHKTTMISIAHMQHVITYPQLAEMHYMFAVFLGQKDATRYLHFSFFLLILSLLIQIGREKQNLFQYSPLLFVTTPLIIKYAPTSYTDLFMVFCLFLSVVILLKLRQQTYKKIVLSGMILGGAFSVKLWTFIFLPLYFFFNFFYIKDKKFFIPNLLILSIISLFPPIVWYIRSYILKGNPIYPIFSNPYDINETLKNTPTIFNYININWRMFSMENIILFSPLFFIGILSFVFYFRTSYKVLKKSPITIFIIFLSVEHFLFNISVARYLLAWYVFAILVASVGIKYLLKSRIGIIGILSIYSILLFYYGLNTLILLPYGFNWADQNKYLTRVLSRDNSSYYDFNRVFDNKIKKTDLVATYGIFGFYYANFKYIDINNIFTTKNREFKDLTKANASMLLIKGGDLLWFCSSLHIQKCEDGNSTLVASFPKETRKYNLYRIKPE